MGHSVTSAFKLFCFCIEMYSLQLRSEAVLFYKLYTQSLRYVASRYKVSKSSLHRWLTQSNCLAKKKKRTRKSFDSINNAIKLYLEANPYSTLLDLSQMLQNDYSIKRSKSSIHRSIKTIRFSRKKVFRKFYNPKNNQRDYRFDTLASSLEDTDSVSIDESAFYFSDFPRFGYSKKGDRIFKTIPSSFLHPRKLSLLLAIQKDKIVGWQLSEKPFNTLSFSSFVKEKLVCLKQGTKIILDNVAFHKSKASISAFNTLCLDPIFIPPYSPEYNPIEMVFSTIKRRFRSKEWSNMKQFKDYLTTIVSEIADKKFDNYFLYSLQQLKQKMQTNDKDTKSQSNQIS
jgi:transposase